MEWLKQQHRALWRFYREEFGESLLITAAAFLVICLLAFGVGLYVCGQVTRRLRGNEQTRSITSCLSLMGQTLLLALAPLLLAAAFVEAYVTPAVAAWFL